MPEQLSLLVEASPAIVVPTTRDVLLHGADSREVPRHEAAVQVPGVSAGTLEQMLTLAENGLRYNQAPTAAIDLTVTRGAGTNGPIGSGLLHADSRGISHYRTGERATWPQLLRALRARREAEPRVAQARDLAQAYRYLHYYAHAYGTPADTPPRLLASIRAQILTLEGDPDAVDLTR